MREIIVFTLLRTDTTLDLSQKAEKVCFMQGSTLVQEHPPAPQVVCPHRRRWQVGVGGRWWQGGLEEGGGSYKGGGWWVLLGSRP